MVRKSVGLKIPSSRPSLHEIHANWNQNILKFIRSAQIDLTISLEGPRTKAGCGTTANFFLLVLGASHAIPLTIMGWTDGVSTFHKIKCHDHYSSHSSVIMNYFDFVFWQNKRFISLWRLLDWEFWPSMVSGTRFSPSSCWSNSSNALRSPHLTSNFYARFGAFGTLHVHWALLSVLPFGSQLVRASSSGSLWVSSLYFSFHSPLNSCSCRSLVVIVIISLFNSPDSRFGRGVGEIWPAQTVLLLHLWKPLTQIKTRYFQQSYGILERLFHHLSQAE